MCFSAPASFIAGTVLTATGVVTIKKVKKKREIPLALIPLFFGVQQLIEGVVWLSFNWAMPFLNSIATYSFAVFAYAFWPIYVPITILLVETVLWRKKVIIICAVLGTSVGFYLLSLIILFPVSSHIINNSIQYLCYSFHLPFSLQAVFYITATCVSTLFSSHKMIRLLGIATIIFLGIAYYFYAITFASVWCFFAALLSLIIYAHFNFSMPRHTTQK